MKAPGIPALRHPRSCTIDEVECILRDSIGKDFTIVIVSCTYLNFSMDCEHNLFLIMCMQVCMINYSPMQRTLYNCRYFMDGERCV